MIGDLDFLHFGGSHGTAPVVCATAALNGLAFSPYQTWAFRRAELTAFAETPFLCANGARAIMAQVRTLDPRMQGGGRLALLTSSCIAQLGPALGTAPPDTPVGVVLCLPERMADGCPQWCAAQRRAVEDTVREELGARGLRPALVTVARGHASLAYAMLEAGGALAGGRAQAVLVGGVDTAFDPPVVQGLLEAQRLFDGENLDSIIPGEGAAFALLAQPGFAHRCRWPTLAVLEGAATSREPATMSNDLPCLGLGLSRPAVAMTERLRQEKRTLDWWLSDMTAEDLRVQEFQLAWPRAARGAMPPSSLVELLYEHLGDLGAAVMPTALAIAVEGFRRGDPLAATCLITGSSVTEDRGVVLVGRAPA
jgi:3-oxoacyl-[acyl-carrier-protein] synthase I